MLLNLINNMSSHSNCVQCHTRFSSHLFLSAPQLIGWNKGVTPLCFNCSSNTQILEQLKYCKEEASFLKCNLNSGEHNSVELNNIYDEIEILNEKSLIISSQPKINSTDLETQVKSVKISTENEISSCASTEHCVDESLIQRYFVP